MQQWQDRPYIERLDAAWELMVDAWKLKKYDLNELRFQRSVTIVKEEEVEYLVIGGYAVIYQRSRYMAQS